MNTDHAALDAARERVAAAAEGGARSVAGTASTLRLGPEPSRRRAAGSTPLPPCSLNSSRAPSSGSPICRRVREISSWECSARRLGFSRFPTLYEKPGTKKSEFVTRSCFIPGFTVGTLGNPNLSDLYSPLKLPSAPAPPCSPHPVQPRPLAAVTPGKHGEGRARAEGDAASTGTAPTRQNVAVPA